MHLVPKAQRRLLAAAAFAVIATAALAQPPASTPSQAPATPAAAPPADFAVCSACHESTANAGPSLGPNLFGVGGRKAGGVPDYDYSPALKASGLTWTADTLATFILDPAKAVPGNKMDYPGASDPAAAKAIADYLMTLKG
jgi:cytochrome c